MGLRYVGLARERFAHLFELPEEELAARRILRVIADEKPGFPCRITLEDAEPGERVLLLPFEHHPVHSPYRASGPIFVREEVRAAYDRVGDPPPVFAGRLLSVRAYDGNGIMVDAEVAQGSNVAPLLGRFFDSPAAAYAHVHFARRGCFACRVERA